MKSLEPTKNFKTQTSPLVRPSSVNFCQNFFNLSHETVPFNAVGDSFLHVALAIISRYPQMQIMQRIPYVTSNSGAHVCRASVLKRIQFVFGMNR